MSRTIPYADLGKAPNDLIGKGFPAASTIKLSHEGTVPFGVLFKNSLTSKIDGSRVGLTIEPEYKTKLGDNPVNIKGKWTSNDELEASCGVSDLVQNGTELKGWFNRSRNDKKNIEVKGGLELGFTNDTVNVKVKTESPSDLSKHKIDAAVVAHYPQNIYWGVNLQYTHSAGKSADGQSDSDEERAPAGSWGGRLHYIQPDNKGSVTVAYEVDPKSKDNHNVQQLSFTWHQKYADTNFATSFVLPPGKNPYAVFVTDNKYDSRSSVKSKVTVGTESRLAVAYTHVCNDYMTGTVGVDLNANKLVGGSGGGDHAFGFEVKLK